MRTECYTMRYMSLRDALGLRPRPPEIRSSPEQEARLMDRLRRMHQVTTLSRAEAVAFLARTRPKSAGG